MKKRGMRLPMVLLGREKCPHRFCIYVALISHIIDYEPSNYEEEHMAPPVVRQVAPPSTILEGSIFQRESTVKIQQG